MLIRWLVRESFEARTKEAQVSKPISSFYARDLSMVSAMATLAHAQALMESRGVRHLPVFEPAGDVIGVLSDRDIARAALAGGDGAPDDLVMKWMSWPIETIDETATVADAARAMLETNVSCLLVISHDRLVGIASTTDLLKAVIADAEGPLDRAAQAIESAFARWPVGQVADALSNAGI